MEVFLDFGLFEVIGAMGVSFVARKVYSLPVLRTVFLFASLAFPGLLIFLADRETLRWLAAGCVATSLVNVSVVLGALQQGDVPTFTLTRGRKKAERD